MTTQAVKLIDQTRTVLATGQVTEEADHYGGSIDLTRTPVHVRRLFEEFEEIVNGQMFSFLQEIQEKIAALDLTAAFENGKQIRVRDLQVFPSTGDFSFKTASVPAVSAKPG